MSSPTGSINLPHNETGTHAIVVPQRAVDIAKVALGALGVVYGDIGTSPLYAVKECVSPGHGVPPTAENVLGILSLIFWSITLVVSLKYLFFVMRADNNGEGGVLALMALAVPSHDTSDRASDNTPTVTAEEAAERARALASRRNKVFIVLGLVGAALLYGDGMITPAISVLSAIEGLNTATTAFEHLVVPITCVILIGLFLVQKHGTAGIARIFGPTMLVWFFSLAVLGVPQIIHHPEVLEAVNPIHGVRFFQEHGYHGFLALGAVVLCITGAEALYADMGHFGRRPIRLAWYGIAFPALLINYFGQGALLLAHPDTANPFYGLVPTFWLYPMVLLATIATVIASQALISGAFSLTRQAVQLGYSPRVTIIHTSGKAEGQIYIPEVNALLLVACVALVLAFRDSSRLAAAYGIAVTGTMAITSVLFGVTAKRRWGWSRGKVYTLVSLFLAIDLAFFLANSAKISEGGWLPLAIAAVGFLVMDTWKRGRAMLSNRLAEAFLPLKDFVADLELCKPIRVPGTAVFLSSSKRGTPNVLLHHFKHNKVLHENIVILSITTDEVPEVRERKRIRFKRFGHGFYAVTAHFGFMETPNVPSIMRLCKAKGLPVEEATASYYLGRETLLPGPRNALSRPRKQLFSFLARNARSATDFFGIPPSRVVEIGVQVEL